jgi:hypothetical protein
MCDAQGWVASVATGETLILPAGQAATLTGRRSTLVLRGWVPDLAREVIAPARAAGVPDAALRTLGVPLTGDVGTRSGIVSAASMSSV